MWLHNAKTGATTIVVHPDAIARCLGDGWVECADPRMVIVDPVATEPVATEVAAAEGVGAAASVASPPADGRLARYQPPVRKKGRR